MEKDRRNVMEVYAIKGKYIDIERGRKICHTVSDRIFPYYIQTVYELSDNDIRLIAQLIDMLQGVEHDKSGI